MSDNKLDKFTLAYIEAALWSSTDSDGKPLDSNYSVHDLAPETLASMVADCEDFQSLQVYQDAFQSDLIGNSEQNGHDFWLTRNRHGAGFWDRGYGTLGRTLTDMAHPYGSVDLYAGDDGLIHSVQG